MYNNILFPIDIDDEKAWKTAIPKIVSLCQAFPGAKLTMMTAIQTYGLGVIEEYIPKGWAREAAKKSKNILQEIVDQYIPKDIETKIVVEKGTVYSSIIELSEAIDADLIVMTAHHPDRRDYLLGPNVAKVVRHSDRSVLVVRD